jgi:hypothetical protein
MNATKQLVAAVLLASVGSGCDVAANRPTGNPPAANPTAANPAAANPTAAYAPAGPAMHHGIRWEPTLAEAIARSRKSYPGKPIVLLRLLGALDDRL